MGHQQRNRRLVHEIVGHAAEQPLSQGQMTVSAHDDKVSLSPFSLCDQPGSDFAMAALDAMKDGVDTISAASARWAPSVIRKPANPAKTRAVLNK